MPKLELTLEEAEYLKDILSMWMEGCEQELRGVASTVPTDEVHWAATGLRRQFTSAQEIHIRLEVILNE